MATKKVIYPVYKKVLIKASRTFFGAFVSVLALQLSTGIDMANLKQYSVNLIISGTAAGLSALGKWMREKNSGDYSNFAYKLPV